LESGETIEVVTPELYAAGSNGNFFADAKRFAKPLVTIAVDPIRKGLAEAKPFHKKQPLITGPSS
jgi:hypothetical protein